MAGGSCLLHGTSLLLSAVPQKVWSSHSHPCCHHTQVKLLYWALCGVNFKNGLETSVCPKYNGQVTVRIWLEGSYYPCAEKSALATSLFGHTSKCWFLPFSEELSSPTSKDLSLKSCSPFRSEVVTRNTTFSWVACHLCNTLSPGSFYRLDPRPKHIF